jgi:hypothetical protein
MRQQARNANRGGVGNICEINIVINTGKFIDVVNSKISCKLNKIISP